MNISLYGYIRNEVSWLDFMYTFFVFFFSPTTCHGPFVYRLVRSMMLCVCVARLTSLLSLSPATISNMISSKIVLLCLIGTAAVVVVVVFF